MDTVDRIFKLLDESSLSQVDFANKLGVGKSLITDWKAKRVHSYNKYLDKIAECFDVSTDYLLCKTDIKKEPPKSERLIELLKDPFAKQVYDKYIKLNQSGKEQFEKYLDFLLSTQDKK